MSPMLSGSQKSSLNYKRVLQDEGKPTDKTSSVSSILGSLSITRTFDNGDPFGPLALSHCLHGLVNMVWQHIYLILVDLPGCFYLIYF